MQQGSRWYFLLTNFVLPLSVPAQHLLRSQCVAPHKREIRLQRGEKGGVEWSGTVEGRRERGTFVGHHLWLNSILYLFEIKMNARQASSCVREEQSNHEGTCFFLCECITATQSSAAECSQRCKLRPNNLRPQLSKSIHFDTFRFALVQVDLIRSCSVHFSSVQAEPASCWLFWDTTNSKIIQVFCRDHRKWRSPACDSCSACSPKTWSKQRCTEYFMRAQQYIKDWIKPADKVIILAMMFSFLVRNVENLIKSTEWMQ